MTYDYQILALTLPNQFCSETQCIKNWKDIVSGLPLTIHGFWPTSTNLAYLSCMKDQGYDVYCHRDFNFTTSLFNSSELAELKKYWPTFGNVKNFWQYEWDKHGTCYLHIIKNEYKSSMSDASVFKKYFMGALNKFKGLDIKLVPGKVATKVDLAKQLGLHSSEFYAICGYDNQLDEIRICYDVYEVPGQELIMQCPKNTDRSQCTFPIVVK